MTSDDLVLWPWGMKFSQNIFSYVSHICARIEPNLSIFCWSKSLGNSKGHDLDLWPWGTEFLHNIFSYVSCVCAWIEPNLVIFFLDQNHLKTPKVMTLTFDLENGKRPYLIKLWCVLCLNVNFCYCILKTL